MTADGSAIIGDGREPLVCEVELTMREFLVAQRYAPGVRRRRLYSIVHFGFVGLGLLVYGRLVEHASDRRLVIILVVVAAFAALIDWLYTIYLNSIAWAWGGICLNHQGAGRTTYRFGEGGIDIDSHEREQHFDWSSLVDQVETPDSFVLSFPQYWPVPKRAFQLKQVVELRRLLASRKQPPPPKLIWHVEKDRASLNKVLGRRVVMTAVILLIFRLLPN